MSRLRSALGNTESNAQNNNGQTATKTKKRTKKPKAEKTTSAPPPPPVATAPVEGPERDRKRLKTVRKRLMVSFCFVFL